VELVVSDPCISQEHGRIWLSDNKYWYEDNGSTHGSKINDKDIITSTVLSKGDRLKLGNSIIEIEETYVHDINLGVDRIISQQRRKSLSPGAFVIGGLILAGLIILINSKEAEKKPTPEIIVQFHEIEIKDEKAHKKGDNAPFTGSAVCSYSNGQLWAKAKFKSGREDGTYEIWYEDGTLMHQAEYVMGIFSGSVKWWGPDGSLALEMTYLDGQETELISHSDFTVPINAIPQIAE